MKLEELQRLAEGATPGPWQVEVMPSGRTTITSGQLFVAGDECGMGLCPHNAAFLAATREVMPKLIAVALAGVHAHAEMARWSGIASGEGFWDAMNTLGTALEELK